MSSSNIEGSIPCIAPKANKVPKTYEPLWRYVPCEPIQYAQEDTQEICLDYHKEPHVPMQYIQGNELPIEIPELPASLEDQMTLKHPFYKQPHVPMQFTKDNILPFTHSQSNDQDKQNPPSNDQGEQVDLVDDFCLFEK